MTRMMPLKDQVEREVPWILDLGFGMVSYSYDPKIFGDSMVVLRSNDLCLRIIRGRGRLFAELAPVTDPEHWWDLSLLLAVIHGEPSEHDLRSIANSVRENLPALAEALGPKLSETTRDIEHLLLERQQEAMVLSNQARTVYLKQRERGLVVVFIMALLVVAWIVWAIRSLAT